MAHLIRDISRLVLFINYSMSNTGGRMVFLVSHHLIREHALATKAVAAAYPQPLSMLSAEVSSHFSAWRTGRGGQLPKY